MESQTVADAESIESRAALPGGVAGGVADGLGGRGARGQRGMIWRSRRGVTGPAFSAGPGGVAESCDAGPAFTNRGREEAATLAREEMEGLTEGRDVLAVIGLHQRLEGTVDVEAEVADREKPRRRSATEVVRDAGRRAWWRASGEPDGLTGAEAKGS